MFKLWSDERPVKLPKFTWARDVDGRVAYKEGFKSDCFRSLADFIYCALPVILLKSRALKLNSFDSFPGGI